MINTEQHPVTLPPSYSDIIIEREVLMQKYIHLVQIVETEKVAANQLRTQLEDQDTEIERLKAEVDMFSGSHYSMCFTYIQCAALTISVLEIIKFTALSLTGDNLKKKLNKWLYLYIWCICHIPT